MPPEALPGGIVLEPLGARHAEALYRVLADPALYRFLDYGPPASVEHLRELYGRLASGAPEGRGQAWVLQRLGFRPATAVEADGRELTASERLYVFEA